MNKPDKRAAKVVGAGLLAGGLLLGAPAGLAFAAPGNGGVPGQIGGITPGSVFSDAAKVPGASVPSQFGGMAPGQLVKGVAGSLGHGGGEGGPPV
jgi:hypothetical protein